MIRSIGEILKRAREKNKISLEKVCSDIKIQPLYIKALESDDYKAFSGKVHSKGFLKIYSEYLGVNTDEVLALWRREYENEFDKMDKSQLLPKKAIESKVLLITPSLIFSSIALGLIILFFGYLYFQYRNFTGAPKLDITFPPDNYLSTIDVLDITGKTDIDSELYLNGQKIKISPDGTFVESIRLKEGLNSLNIKATNKYTKQTELIKNIIYRPSQERSPLVDESTQTTPSVVPTR